MLTKDELQIEISNGGTWRTMANRFGCSVSTIRHYLDKYGLQTSFALTKSRPRLKCSREKTPEERAAGVEAVRRRRFKLRDMAIEFLGGKCLRTSCGYHRFKGALEFHHKDPNEKEQGFLLRGTTYSWERIKEELKKCVLLCANCHREVHDEMRKPGFSLDEFLSS